MSLETFKTDLQKIEHKNQLYTDNEKHFTKLIDALSESTVNVKLTFSELETLMQSLFKDEYDLLEKSTASSRKNQVDLLVKKVTINKHTMVFSLCAEENEVFFVTYEMNTETVQRK